MQRSTNEFTDILKVQGVNAKGFGIIPKLVMQDRRLTRDAKTIYSYIRSFAGAGTTAFPSVKKICYDLCFGKEDTFRKHRKLLEQYGYIKVEQERSENGLFKRNVYTIIDKPIELVSDTLKEGDGKNPVKPRVSTDTPFEGHREKGAPVKGVYNNNNSSKSNSINKNNNNTEEVVVKKTEHKNIIKDFTNEIKNIINENITDYDAMVLHKVADGDINLIKEKYAIAKSYKTPIKNLVGFLTTAIIKDFKNISSTSTKNNTFCDNHEQRDFDFEELEKLEFEYMCNYDRE